MSDDASAKPLVDSTDDELLESSAKPVPNTPDEEVKQEGAEAHDEVHCPNPPEVEQEEAHEADSFVPNPDREKTLEGSAFTLNVKPEMFEIGI